MELQLDVNTTRTDEMYELIIHMHHGLSLSESERVNARLILLLANHVGDIGVVRRATEIALKRAPRHGEGNE